MGRTILWPSAEEQLVNHIVLDFLAFILNKTSFYKDKSKFLMKKFTGIYYIITLTSAEKNYSFITEQIIRITQHNIKQFYSFQK